jgi:hypothetical protein
LTVSRDDGADYGQRLLGEIIHRRRPHPAGLADVG